MTGGEGTAALFQPALLDLGRYVRRITACGQ